LGVVRGGASGSTARGTTNVQAHDLYLRGLGQWQVRREDELRAAKESFERAIAADPRFPRAGVVSRSAMR